MSLWGYVAIHTLGQYAGHLLDMFALHYNNLLLCRTNSMHNREVHVHLCIYIETIYIMLVDGHRVPIHLGHLVDSQLKASDSRAMCCVASSNSQQYILECRNRRCPRQNVFSWQTKQFANSTLVRCGLAVIQKLGELQLYTVLFVPFLRSDGELGPLGRETCVVARNATNGKWGSSCNPRAEILPRVQRECLPPFLSAQAKAVFTGNNRHGYKKWATASINIDIITSAMIEIFIASSLQRWLELHKHYACTTCFQVESAVHIFQMSSARHTPWAPIWRTCHMPGIPNLPILFV